MPRPMRRNEHVRAVKGRRDAALARSEMGQPTSPRRPAGGVVSMAMKINEDQHLIEEFMARKAGQEGTL